MLTFDAEKHEYWEDGIKLPSVTEICQFANTKDFSGVPPHMRDAAAERGTLIHELCVELDMEGTVECPPELSGYLQAYADFKRGYRVKDWDWIEKMVGGVELGYAGTLDRAGKVEGDQTILDIKTGSNVDKLTLFAQLCGYRKAAPGNYTRLMGLQLRRDGTYRVYEFPGLDFMRSMFDGWQDPFELCFALYKRREELNCRRKRA